MSGGSDVCSRCGSAVPKAEMLQVDSKAVCRRCLHGGAQPFLMYPIGYVRKGPELSPARSSTTEQGAISRLELFDTMRPFMGGLQDEQHLTVVYVLHEARGVRTTFNRGLDGKQVGIFASRSPGRVNPIAVTEVELVKVEGTTLLVRGLDATDGSPVLDLKLGYKACRR